MKKIKIGKAGGARFVHAPGCGVGIYTGMDSSNTTTFPEQASISWEAEPEIVAGHAIVPYGIGNNLPVHIRDIMEVNNLAPGILEREKGLLYGQGPELYRKEYKDGDVSRQWGEDTAIQAWLNSWDYLRYIDMAITEYKYLHGVFDKVYLARGARIGRNTKIAKLEVVPGVDARLGWVKTRKLEDVKQMYVGDFENGCFGGISTYPVFNKNTPFDHRVAMAYRNSYSYARNLYSIPSFYGTLNWIQRSSDVPVILKYITDNMINVAFHIQSPEGYWEKQEDKLKDKCTSENKMYTTEMLDQHKDDVFRRLAETLSGKRNIGKFFHTVITKDDEGNSVEWKVTPIDQKITDFIDAQVKVSEKADSATTSGIGLHPSLSNIMIDGKLSSGSEMLYALKLYLASDTTVPEEVILQSINTAIQINFPGTPWRMGFYHKIVLREEDVSPKDRTTKNI